MIAISLLKARSCHPYSANVSMDRHHVLLVRGTANVEVIEGVPPEYLEGAKKQVGAQLWQGFEAQVRRIYKQMARITIVPEWAELLDFETRIPGFMRQLIKS
jgi:hypothetical protein